MDINYIIDKEGKHSAVVVPIKQWKNFLDKFSKMKKKLEILTGLEDAVDEVNQMKKGKKQPKSLADFLDEN